MGQVKLGDTRKLRSEVLRDGMGRSIPANLIPIFSASQQLLRDVDKSCRELIALVRRDKLSPFGRALNLQMVRKSCRELHSNIQSALPFIICPYLQDDGCHVQSGRCRLCLDRNYLSKKRFRQIDCSLRELCEAHRASRLESHSGLELAV